MKRLLTALFVLSIAVPAFAATLALPSVAIIAPSSTSISCTEVGGAGSIHPGAPGTVIFNCVVSPSTWSGTATVGNTKFVAANYVGANFDVLVGSTTIAAGTVGPGLLTATP